MFVPLRAASETIRNAAAAITTTTTIIIIIIAIGIV
jgi:hypothetical protein